MSIDELTKTHNRTRNQLLQIFRSTDLIRQHNEAKQLEDHLDAQIQQLFEISKAKLETAIEKPEEADLAVENAIGYYRSCMHAHLKATKKCKALEKLTESDFHEAHLRFQVCALNFFRSNFEKDLESERVTKGEKKLQEKISSALRSICAEYLTDVPAKSCAAPAALPNPSASKERVEQIAESSELKLMADDLKDECIELFELFETRVMNFVVCNPDVSDADVELKQLRIGKEILQELRADPASAHASAMRSVEFGMKRKWLEMKNQIQNKKQKSARKH